MKRPTIGVFVRKATSYSAMADILSRYYPSKLDIVKVFGLKRWDKLRVDGDLFFLGALSWFAAGNPIANMSYRMFRGKLAFDCGWNYAKRLDFKEVHHDS